MNTLPGRVFCTLFLFTLVTFYASSQAWKTYPLEPGGSLIVFPGDEGRHSDEPVEWWYVSGHIRGETSGSDYSFMISYFYYPAYGFDGFRILNISNDNTDYFYSNTQALTYGVCSTDSLNLEVNILGGGTEIFRNVTDQDNKALPFEYELSTIQGSGSLSLTMDAIKPPLILADSGFLYQGSEAYTYYYSLPMLTAEGTIVADGITENVSGTAWIDRQYGTFNPSNGQEYEWFCVQLSNGVELNLNNIFTEDNRVPDTITYRLLAASVDEHNQYTTSDLNIERLKYAYMEDWQKCYSQEWRITSPINNIDLTLRAKKSNTEVILPFRFYEGAVEVEGSYDGVAVSGVGFAELLHSYDRPSVSVIDTANISVNNYNLMWKIDNQDDGNPLLYDLYYSQGDSLSYQLLAQSIADTSYMWNTSVLTEGNEVWLRLRAYSVDNTLVTLFSTKLGSMLVGTPVTESEPEILLYPNPSDGRIIIYGQDIDRIELIDLSGRTLQSLVPNTLPMELYLESLNSGIYYLKLSIRDKHYIRTLVIR